MTDRWIGHLPMVDGGKLVGVISQRDLAGVLAGALNEPEAVQQLVEASELTGNAGLGVSSTASGTSALITAPRQRGNAEGRPEGRPSNVGTRNSVTA